MSRDRYEQSLRELQADLLRMGSLVEHAIGRSIEALKNQDVDEAHRIITDDSMIDRAQYELEEKALRLMATQAPLAGDLRAINAALSIASELERMGDYAEGIAGITVRLAKTTLPHLLDELPLMAVKAQKMLRAALDSYTRHDVEAARMLANADDEVDALTETTQHALIEQMTKQPAIIEQATRLLYVTHNLERIADRATNIGERVVFMVTGEIKGLNE